MASTHLLLLSPTRKLHLIGWNLMAPPELPGDAPITAEQSRALVEDPGGHREVTSAARWPRAQTDPRGGGGAYLTLDSHFLQVLV